jgi:hypothetical protein
MLVAANSHEPVVVTLLATQVDGKDTTVCLIAK